MINIAFDETEVAIVCSSENTLAEASFSIGNGLHWFLSKGVSSFCVERSVKHTTNSPVHFVLKALKKPQPMQFSGVTKIAFLVENNYWPRNVNKKWTLEDNDDFVADGQNRIGIKTCYGTMIQNEDIDQRLTISEVIYGLADLILTLFWFGATAIKHQFSVALSQTLADKAIDSNLLVESFTNDRNGYPAAEKLTILPI